MLKVGDKLLCKKSINTQKVYKVKAYKNLNFYKDHTYKISTINKINSMIYLIVPNFLGKHQNKRVFGFANSEIYEYFYTKQEMRKMKLEKIEK